MSENEYLSVVGAPPVLQRACDPRRTHDHVRQSCGGEIGGNSQRVMLKTQKRDARAHKELTTANVAAAAPHSSRLPDRHFAGLPPGMRLSIRTSATTGTGLWKVVGGEKTAWAVSDHQSLGSRPWAGYSSTQGVKNSEQHSGFADRHLFCKSLPYLCTITHWKTRVPPGNGRHVGVGSACGSYKGRGAFCF